MIRCEPYPLPAATRDHSEHITLRQVVTSLDRATLILVLSLSTALGVLLGAHTADADTVRIDRASGASTIVRAEVPSIGEVLAASYRTAGLDRDLGRGFARRARLSGLVPWLSVRTGRDTSWRDDDDNVSRGMTLEVRATWRLDRLVFEGRELQVVSMDAARRRERRRLAQRVIRVYFEWRRAGSRSGDVEVRDEDMTQAMTEDDVERLSDQRASGARSVRAASRVEELAAELDDVTDGWFTEELVARAQ